ncbi:hypothetical protein [Candidatus Venteria ishoeyi]|uniref:Uncharacterized protein n=1 Tax=Candidatus Venteria ishoeyi TaxID=1899563 RepID=A0A1H6F9F1_9GAMM|nr:hypothetical protein [Candidatus Venteria ishoeyi]SEH05776.1 Uncharacterised protein [Candidatus Venteria ishoeyi]
MRILSLLYFSFCLLPSLSQAASIGGNLPGNSELSIRAVILNPLDQGASVDNFDLQWQETQRSSTSGGDFVIAGYFYASSSQVSWGSDANPEVYVKIWFGSNNILNLNFFHVGVFDIELSSTYNGTSPTIEGGKSGNTKVISIGEASWRYMRHDYVMGTDDNMASSGGCSDLSGTWKFPTVRMEESCSGIAIEIPMTVGITQDACMITHLSIESSGEADDSDVAIEVVGNHAKGYAENDSTNAENGEVEFTLLFDNQLEMALEGFTDSTNQCKINLMGAGTKE